MGSVQTSNLLTAADLAARLQLPISSVYAHAKPGGVLAAAALRIGGRIRFDPSKLADILAACSLEPAPGVSAGQTAS